MSLRGSRALAQISSGAFRYTPHSQPALRRTFTQSSRLLRYGPVPKFENLSSPELESLLNNVRLKIIMPTHLSVEQRELIYKQRHAKSLVTDPVSANLGGESFILEPINRTTDVPPLRKSLFNALDLMTAKSDWDILPRLLKGLRQAGLQTSVPALSSIIRKAARAGRQDIILACVRQVEDTGFKLDMSELTREILWSFQSMAVHSDFDLETTKKALSWSEQIFEMIELPAHAGNGLAPGEVDPRTQPMSVGILLKLAAARAVKHLDGKDVDGRVAKYANMLASTSLEFEPSTPKKNWIAEKLPILYGMKSSLKILDPSSEVAKKLQVATDTLEATIDSDTKRLVENGDLKENGFAVVYKKKLAQLL